MPSIHVAHNIPLPCKAKFLKYMCCNIKNDWNLNFNGHLMCFKSILKLLVVVSCNFYTTIFIFCMMYNTKFHANDIIYVVTLIWICNWFSKWATKCHSQNQNTLNAYKWNQTGLRLGIKVRKCKPILGNYYK